jgi:hypothetical protein
MANRPKKVINKPSYESVDLGTFDMIEVKPKSTKLPQTQNSVTVRYS